MITTPDAAILESLLVKLRTEIDLPNIQLSSGFYYASLPFALVDAVFSIGTRYEAVVNAVHHLARQASWEVYRPHGSPYLPIDQQRTVSDLLREFDKTSDPTKVFANKGFANPKAKTPIRKAELVQRMARVLVDNRIETFDDFAAFADPDAIDRTLSQLPSLTSGVVVSYLRMLAGADDQIKPDRHIHAFIRAAIGDATRVVSNADAVSLMREAARSLAVPPRLLDHGVWSVQRQIRAQKRNLASTPALSLSALGATPKLSPGVTAINGHLSMTAFWNFCVKGGVTGSGLKFLVDEQQRLHIISPRSSNKNYKISKSTVARYLPHAHEVRFRRDHGWFVAVHDFALIKRV